MRSTLAAGLLALAGLLAAPAGLASKPASPARAGTLTPELVLGIRSVGDVTVAPTGDRVAWVVGVPRGEKDDPGNAFQEIWVAPVRGGTPRRYTPAEERAWAPAFSPDGRQLAFLSTRPVPKAEKSDIARLYALDLGGGEARLVSPRDITVTAFRWSPTGDVFAYTAKDPQTDSEKEDVKAGRDQVVVDATYKPARLWKVPAAGGEPHRITTDDSHVLDFDWAPDGTRLVLRTTRTPRVDEAYLYSSLALVPATGGVPAPVVDTAGKLENPVFAPDGRQVAWLGASDLNDPYPGTVYVAPVSGGTPRALRRGRPGVATWVDWSSDDEVLVAVTLGTETVLEAVSSRNDRVRCTLRGGPVFTEASVGARGQVAVAGSTPDCPAEVWVGEVAGAPGAFRRLSTTNPSIEAVRLSPQRAIRWRAKDGLEIEGVLVEPLGFAAGRRFPLVVLAHGGPESCIRNGWTTTYGTPAQLLSSAGCFVLLPNYRGSIGRDEAFERADHGDLMGAEFDDILAGIDDLVARGWVDPERVGVGGGSYGGYTSAWAATAHSPRFAAAVVFAGITNWLSMQGTSDIPEENALVHWNRPFYDNMDLYWQRSPLAHVGSCRTPVLILHGEKDERVPMGQGAELYTALRLLGREVEFVCYPREEHGLKEIAHQRDMLARTLAWFDRHLQPTRGSVSRR